MEIGSCVVTLIDKMTTEGVEELLVPKGTKGTVCEIHGDWALIEIWGPDAPEGVSGVFAFGLSEIKETER